jgi:hypothetical protein
MKRFTLCTFIMAGFAMQTMFAQQAAGPNRLSDDDGGVVQIVPVDAPATPPARTRTRSVMKSVRQVSIFLGTAWAEREARSRERILSDLTDKLGELQGSNTTVLPAAPSVEDFTDLTKTPMNDLAIQRKLTEMLMNKAIPAPDPAVVYAVFLAEGIRSTVGGHVAGVHYAAYHTSIHVDGVEVRYVVVPFNPNAERQAAAASRAIIETAFGPN